MVAFATRNFVHMHNGAVIGAGTIIRALNNDNLEAAYKRTGEEKERLVVLNLGHLHYDALTDSGCCFGEPMFDYSDLPKKAVDD